MDNELFGAGTWKYKERGRSWREEVKKNASYIKVLNVLVHRRKELLFERKKYDIWDD